VFFSWVAHSTDGQIQTVQYQKVNAMLLNEVQKQHRQIQRQQEEMSAVKARLSELERQLERLAARGESRLAQKPGQPPYFAHREASIESMRSVAKYGDCPRLLRFGPFCCGLLAFFLGVLGRLSRRFSLLRGPYLEKGRRGGVDRL
jgi:hypothetical protein